MVQINILGKNTDKKIVLIILGKDQLTMIQKLSDMWGFSKSKVIRKLIEKGLTNSKHKI